MFSPPELPHDNPTFLRNLELELRSGAPMASDTLDIRLAEYLSPDAPEAVEAELRTAAITHLKHLITQQQAQATTWIGPTDVDRLRWALAGATIGLRNPQLHHVGLPHAFLPSGDVAIFEPCEGSRNLPRALREPLIDRSRAAQRP